MVHDDSYKEPKLTKEDQAEENKIKQKVFLKEEDEKLCLNLKSGKKKDDTSFRKKMQKDFGEKTNF